jgi:thiol-disulfide isomerase/thioredoxin
MKKLTQHIILAIFLFGLWNCQPVLKAPAATIMSATLPTPEINTPENIEKLPDADFNLQVKDLNGKPINMADYRGKVIFLNFWATWCMPCVAELPSINKLYLQFKDENVVFLLISNEQLEKVVRYHERKKYDIPFYIIDNEGFIPQQYFSQSIPTTFIINKEGKIVKASAGAEDWDDKEFVETLKKML